MTSKRISLEKKLEYLSLNWIFYELWYWNVNDRPSHVLIVTKWSYDWATYRSKSISRLIGKLYNDVSEWNQPDLITKKV